MSPSQRSGRVVVIAMACLGMAVSLALGQEPAEAQKVEIPATATTLEGIPTVRIDSAQAGATRRLLSGAEASKDRLTVTVVNGQFYWASRLNDKISYVEHVDLGLGSVTWWGELRIAGGKQRTTGKKLLLRFAATSQGVRDAHRSGVAASM